MQYKLIRLPVKTVQEYSGTIVFEGRSLGCATDRDVVFDIGDHAIRIYQVKDGGFLTYLFYRDCGGLQLAELVRTDNLNFHEVRSALKRSGVYPGPHFSRAVYHSLDTLQSLEKTSE